MDIYHYLNFRTIILIFSGLLLIFGGAWMGYRRLDYIFGGGVILVGVGNLFFGITNGFTDPTPLGSVFFRAGAFSYIVGALLVGYSLRHLI